jgi:hypothetical protein
VESRADLRAQLEALLYRHDPIGIAFEDVKNYDEYEPEVRTILPRLREATSGEDVLQLVHEEFVHWFGADTAGPKERYAAIARDIWSLWTSEGR